MKNDNIIIKTAIPGLIATAAILLSLHISIGPDGLAGFATIAMLLAIGALEYRTSPPRKAANTTPAQPRVRPSSPPKAAYAPSSRLPKRGFSGLVPLR